jgi:predicted amidohydrolase YtcJ
MAGHALSEALHATGDSDAARAALAPVIRRLSAIASTIPSAEDRHRFWHRPLANASALRLATDLGVCPLPAIEPS